MEIFAAHVAHNTYRHHLHDQGTLKGGPTPVRVGRIKSSQ